MCCGYANLTAALMEAANIPCRVVNGYALGLSADNNWDISQTMTPSTNHAWNEAYIDGRWIIIDTTWDSGNEYENGAIKKSTGLRSRIYFDPTLESFSLSHKILS